MTVSPTEIFLGDGEFTPEAITQFIELNPDSAVIWDVVYGTIMFSMLGLSATYKDLTRRYHLGTLNKPEAFCEAMKAWKQDKPWMANMNYLTTYFRIAKLNDVADHLETFFTNLPDEKPCLDRMMEYVKKRFGKLYDYVRHKGTIRKASSANDLAGLKKGKHKLNRTNSLPDDKVLKCGIAQGKRIQANSFSPKATAANSTKPANSAPSSPNCGRKVLTKNESNRNHTQTEVFGSKGSNINNQENQQPSCVISPSISNEKVPNATSPLPPKNRKPKKSSAKQTAEYTCPAKVSNAPNASYMQHTSPQENTPQTNIECKKQTKKGKIVKKCCQIVFNTLDFTFCLNINKGQKVEVTNNGQKVEVHIN